MQGCHIRATAWQAGCLGKNMEELESTKSTAEAYALGADEDPRHLRPQPARDWFRWSFNMVAEMRLQQSVPLSSAGSGPVWSVSVPAGHAARIQLCLSLSNHTQARGGLQVKARDSQHMPWYCTPWTDLHQYDYDFTGLWALNERLADPMYRYGADGSGGLRDKRFRLCERGVSVVALSHDGSW